ncbi:MAG: hypothetical protein ACTS3R_12600 [Inquilinaceae bacterium]
MTAYPLVPAKGRWAAFALIAAICGLIAVTPSAGANEDAEQFYGTYVGSATVYDADGTMVEERDMDIVVEAAKRGGLALTWTNVTLVDGRRDVPGVQRRVDALTLVPGDDLDIYLEDTRGSLFERRRDIEAMEGDAVRWARIDKGRLGVFSLVITDDGGYELQSYERILTDIGIDIDFRRIVDGKVVRRIEGTTVRVE